MIVRPRTLLLIAAAVAIGVSCQPQPGPPPVIGALQHVRPVAGAANVAVRIGLPGLAVKTLPMTLADVATVTVTLLDGANAQVSSPGLTNPITITLPATTGTFTAVPPGTGYTIDVVARDAGGVSITSGTRNGNSANVAAGTATYSSGSALVKTIDLSPGTASTDSSSSTLTPAVGTTLTFDRFKWMLVNNRSKATVASSLLSTPPAITMTGVQPGAVTGATHDLWIFSGVDASKKALPMQRFAAPANAAGTIANPFNTTLTAVGLTTPSATAVAAADALPLTTDDSANVYYVDTANQIIKRGSGNGYAATVLFTAAAAPTGFATDGAGNVYYSTGNDILMRSPPLYDTDTTLITTTGVSRIAVDEFKNLYWINGSQELAYAACLGSTTYQVVTVQAGAGLPLAVTGATMLAADAYGNVYSSDGASIIRRARSSYGFWDGSASNAGPLYPTAATVVVAANISGFAVDRAGDIYFTQTGSNELKLVPRNGPNTDHFTVAGSGTVATPGSTSLTGDPLTLANFRAPLRPAVSSLGVVFCTTTGDDDTTHFLRRIAP